MKTDDELKQLLAKMLPEQVEWTIDYALSKEILFLFWKIDHVYIKESELLHVCWLIEQTLTVDEMYLKYKSALSDVVADKCLKTHTANLFRPSWQQRTMALAKVKGLLC